MSRPNESEPNRKVCLMYSPSSVVISPDLPGTRSRLEASKSVGSTVPSQGAASATSTSAASTAPPRRTDQLRRARRQALSPTRTFAASTESGSVADAGVEEDIREVDQQVDGYVHHGEEQDHALDGREIARQ